MKKLFSIIASAVALSAAANTNDLEFLTVREDGTFPTQFSNTVGTVTHLARLQAEMDIAAEKARQAERIYSSTTGLLAQATKQLSQIQSVGYADYYLVSFESAMIIDGNRDKVAIYKFDYAPQERKMEGRESFDCYYAFKGECDIQQLKQIFKIGIVGETPTDDWSYLADEYVDNPVPQGPWTDKDGVVYNYSYRTTVHLPNDLGRCMLLIHIRDQAADTDGSVVLIHGGDAGGMTGTKTLGDTRIQLIGGRIFGWEGAVQ